MLLSEPKYFVHFAVWVDKVDGCNDYALVRT